MEGVSSVQRKKGKCVEKEGRALLRDNASNQPLMPLWAQHIVCMLWCSWITTSVISTVMRAFGSKLVNVLTVVSVKFPPEVQSLFSEEERITESTHPRGPVTRAGAGWNLTKKCLDLSSGRERSLCRCYICRICSHTHRDSFWGLDLAT